MEFITITSVLKPLVERFWDQEAPKITLHSIFKLYHYAECESFFLFDQFIGYQKEGEVFKRMKNFFQITDRLVHLITLREILYAFKLFEEYHSLILLIENKVCHSLSHLLSEKEFIFTEKVERKGHQSYQEYNRFISRKPRHEMLDLLEKLLYDRDNYLSKSYSLSECYSNEILSVYENILGIVESFVETWTESDKMDIHPQNPKLLFKRNLEKNEFNHYLLYVISVARFLYSDLQEENLSEIIQLIETHLLPYFEKLVRATFVDSGNEYIQYCEENIQVLSRLIKKEDIALLYRSRLSLLILNKHKILKFDTEPCRRLVEIMGNMKYKENLSIIPIFPDKYLYHADYLADEFKTVYKLLQRILKSVPKEWIGAKNKTLLLYLLQKTLDLYLVKMEGIFQVLIQCWKKKDKKMLSPVSNIYMIEHQHVAMLNNELHIMLKCLKTYKNMSSAGISKEVFVLAENYVFELLDELHTVRKLENLPIINENNDCGVNKRGTDFRKFVNDSRSSLLLNIENKNKGTDLQGSSKTLSIFSVRSETRHNNLLALMEGLLPIEIWERERENIQQNESMICADFLEILSVIFYLTVSYQTLMAMKIFDKNDPLLERITSDADLLISYLKHRNDVDIDVDSRQLHIDKAFVQSLRNLELIIENRKQSSGAQNWPDYLSDKKIKESLFYDLIVSEKTLERSRKSSNYRKRKAPDYLDISIQDYHLILKSITLLLRKTSVRPENLDEKCKKSLKQLYENLVKGGEEKLKYFKTWTKFLRRAYKS